MRQCLCADRVTKRLTEKDIARREDERVPLGMPVGAQGIVVLEDEELRGRALVTRQKSKVAVEPVQPLGDGAQIRLGGRGCNLREELEDDFAVHLGLACVTIARKEFVVVLDVTVVNAPDGTRVEGVIVGIVERTAFGGQARMP